MSDAYVVEVKRSARKVSPAAGRWVREHGTRRRFATKALARQWARVMSPPGRTVWVQDAAPWDGTPVDGYVVGGGARDRGATRNRASRSRSRSRPTGRRAIEVAA
ncbi:hypothetical protein [Halosegnis marinus]|uniref:hypothetical protein n=1 Tax=Halosegnis marinus TaxID=3034023 RepID=UPI003616FBE6